MFLLGHVIVAVCFASLACCGLVRQDATIFRSLKSSEERMVDDLKSCPAVNPKYPVLLPHPDECNKFYICDSGSRYEKVCQSGLHFNPTIRACDYPINAGCDRDATEKPKSRQIGDGISLCPAENSAQPVLLPHSSDCSKFYICDSGLAHLKECHSGLHFNYRIKACDYPEKAGCETGSIEKPKGKIVGDGFRMCPTENTEHPVLLPHQSDCGKFYICDSGTARLQKCQSGLHFNPRIKACDYPERAGCDAGLEFENRSERKSRMVAEGSSCPAHFDGRPHFIPHPSNCGLFSICSGGEKYPLACPLGLHFNSEQNVCDFPDSAACKEGFERASKKQEEKDNAEFPMSCPAGNSPDQPVILPHPTECDKYFICVEGKATLRKCLRGLHFNETLHACSNGESTSCEKQMPHKMSGVASPYCPSKDGKTPVFYRHATNCSVYYMCGNGLAYEFTCPARLHFNVRKRVCDYENNSGCRSADS